MKRGQHWVKKYRPLTADDYIFPEGEAGIILRRYLIPRTSPPYPLILHGNPGVGKSSFIPIFCKAHNLEPCDVQKIAAVDLRGVQDVRDRINILNPWPFCSNFVLLHLEEAQEITNIAVRSLLDIIDENKFAWIFTVNNIDRIDLALQSRCEVIELKPSCNDIKIRVNDILIQEGIDNPNWGLLAEIVDSAYGDIRKIIRQLENEYGNT